MRGLTKRANPLRAARHGRQVRRFVLRPDRAGVPSSLRITPLAEPEAGASSGRPAWPASGADGAPLGSAFLRLFTREGQEHLAEPEFAVHATERRRGVGTRLPEAAVAAARAEGRRSLLAQAEHGSPSPAG
ncbi:GNAT family N-acetyltransferase [Streptomyces sp. NPDC002838]|uniref:GNAT family N-acetyltransferase n=1 Tax=Streptomyces sp. NPDC002838 TaxID=3154436 RepID=UPI00332D6583